ncbi:MULTISPECIES: alpha/beta hydrolase family protein [unclassified Hyphomonas]|uniref:alpha/beta hydrolase family protein n=2 Tax=Hyphomonas TaxID=85 RepID=UPI000C4EEDD7|nr:MULTISPECIES: S9 family peptidase [unclassified Hyphomonas]MAX84183.1 hypothetical protein [Hyphomonas sp.]MDF1807605.1 S9 family peptidase [Hyphomonas sp.]HAO36788.1 hypothetical protein [Hyphomonas sp.]HBN91989.1 hypothetical protein [Hyphomonas sp.]HBU35509.1 hypothetical protein [Hyphomonas sp.]
MLRILAVLAAFFVCGHAVAQEPAPPTLEEFLSEADYSLPTLSPSGRYLAGIQQANGLDFILTVDFSANVPKPVLEPLGPATVNWIEWVNDDCLLISMTGVGNSDADDGRDIEHDIQEAGRSKLWRRRATVITRLVSYCPLDGTSTMLFPNWKTRNSYYSIANVTDLLPEEPNHILMPSNIYGDLDLFKVDIRDGSYERIVNGDYYTVAWYTDRDGVPALRVDRSNKGRTRTVFARTVSTSGKITWEKRWSYSVRADERSDIAGDFEILHPGPSPSTYYIATRLPEENFTAVYLYDFEMDEILETVASKTGIDIEDVVFDPTTQSLLGIVYFDPMKTVEMFDQRLQAHFDGLKARFGRLANIHLLEVRDGGSSWLLGVSGPTRPRSYHLYDAETSAITEIGARKKILNGKLFGSAQIVQYTARDGLEIEGYLTRPRQESAASTSPLIVLPHGGPEARDYFDFRQDVQVLVAAGYQVFQPNFRGSSGFGREFAEMGRREWGAATQTDIEDGYAFLISQGLAEPANACIVGYSYGGYAALAAATQTPELYQCIVSGAGPSDLAKMLQWERLQYGRYSKTYKYWVQHIGQPGSDGEMLKAISPAENADKVTKPVLLIHGTHDEVVPPKQSELMEKALDREGKPVRYVELEDSDHSYMSEKDELTYYTEILAFLETHLPVN